MEELKPKLSLDRQATYKIEVPGLISERWSNWYVEIALTVRYDNDEQPITTLTGTMDQAALQGLLRRLYSLGLPLISVNNLDQNDIDMKGLKMKRPFMLWPLVSVLVFLALGGFSGGIPMLMDPANGGYLQFADLLPLLPVSNLILPGLFLLIVMGLYPLLLAYALIARPTWTWVDDLFKWSKHYWAWTATLIFVAIIALWLIYEGWLIGWFSITYATVVIGFLILLFALMPEVSKYYAKRK
jgi:hypothetical protein